jgi:hypothetical protein
VCSPVLHCSQHVRSTTATQPLPSPSAPWEINLLQSLHAMHQLSGVRKTRHKDTDNFRCDKP